MGQLAYYELNIDTIIQKYCVNKDQPELQCNGKCYLSKQLQMLDSQGDDTSTNLVIEAFFPVYIQNFPQINISNPTQIHDVESTFGYIDNYSLPSHGRVDRPPIS